MKVPGLSDMLISLSEVFPLFVQLVFITMALFGLWSTGIGLYALYAIATGETKFTNRPATIDGAFNKLMLGGALVVAPVLLWRIANSFVLGGDITYSMFSYGGARSSYCEQIHAAITYFFMAIGAFAWLMAAWHIYGASYGERHDGILIRIIFGGLCFFVNDAASLISATLKMDLSFSNVCQLLGNRS